MSVSFSKLANIISEGVTIIYMYIWQGGLDFNNDKPAAKLNGTFLAHLSSVSTIIVTTMSNRPRSFSLHLTHKDRMNEANDKAKDTNTRT